MKREFKLDFSGMLGIFVAGVVIGILGTILFLSVKDAPTSNPHSIFRDFYLIVAPIVREALEAMRQSLGAELEFDIFLVLDGREVCFVMEPV